MNGRTRTNGSARGGERLRAAHKSSASGQRMTHPLTPVWSLWPSAGRAEPVGEPDTGNRDEYTNYSDTQDTSYDPHQVENALVRADEVDRIAPPQSTCMLRMLRSGPGTLHQSIAGQSMTALPGYFRHRSSLRFQGRRRPQPPSIALCSQFFGGRADRLHTTHLLCH